MRGLHVDTISGSDDEKKTAFSGPFNDHLTSVLLARGQLPPARDLVADDVNRHQDVMPQDICRRTGSRVGAADAGGGDRRCDRRPSLPLLLCGPRLVLLGCSQLEPGPARRGSRSEKRVALDMLRQRIRSAVRAVFWERRGDSTTVGLCVSLPPSLSAADSRLLRRQHLHEIHPTMGNILLGTDLPQKRHSVCTEPRATHLSTRCLRSQFSALPNADTVSRTSPSPSSP